MSAGLRLQPFPGTPSLPTSPGMGGSRGSLEAGHAPFFATHSAGTDLAVFSFRFNYVSKVSVLF